MKNVLRLTTLALVLVMMLACLASCFGGPNADPEKAEEALEDNDYVVIVADDKISLGLMGLGEDIDNLECVITAYNEDDEDDAIVIFYFEDKEDADEAFKSDILKDMAEEAEEENDDVVFKKSGKMVYIGTKNAVKAAK